MVGARLDDGLRALNKVGLFSGCRAASPIGAFNSPSPVAHRVNPITSARHQPPPNGESRGQDISL
jgi:hypothetical protein